MANFVEIEYEVGLRESFNLDLIIRIIEPCLTEGNIWNISYFSIYDQKEPICIKVETHKEAQYIYDKLRGKKESSLDLSSYAKELRQMYGLHKCRNCGNSAITHNEFSRCAKLEFEDDQEETPEAKECKHEDSYQISNGTKEGTGWICPSCGHFEPIYFEYPKSEPEECS